MGMVRRLALPFWSRSRRATAPVDPATPHAFRPVHDAGIGAFAIGGGPSGQWSIDAIATTDNFLRKSRCGVQGCEKPASDPIHEAQDPTC